MSKTGGKRGKPRTVKTVEELTALIEQYFKSIEPKPLTYEDAEGKTVSCTDKNGNPVINYTPPTVSGLAYFLGYADRQSLNDIQKRDDDDYSFPIKRAKLLIEKYHEEQLSISGKPTGSIFWMKNNGWRDRSPEEEKDNLTDAFRQIAESLLGE